MSKKIKITIETSARHVHLSRKDTDRLFGKGYELKKLKQLSQPCEYACEEMVTIKTKKGELKARVLGPIRPQTQVELSKTEAIKLGVNPPVRMSADLAGSASVALDGPNGSVKLKEGLILAWRHIHASDKEAAKLGLKHGQLLSVKVGGERGLVFDKVRLKVNPEYRLSMHVDTDEANAAGLEGNTVGEILI